MSSSDVVDGSRLINPTSDTTSASEEWPPWASSLRSVLPLWLLAQLLGYAVVLRIRLADGIGPGTTMASWDSAWYQNIAKYGYRSHPGVLPPGGAFIHLVLFRSAYPPLWPAVIRVGSLLTGGNVVASSALFTAMFSLAAVTLLHRWVLHPSVSSIGGGPDQRGRATAAAGALLLLPLGTWLFYGYSEAMFLTLVLGAVLARLDGRWWLAGSLAAMATLTKYVGVAVVAYVAVSWALDRWRRPASARPAWRTAGALFLGPVALAGWQVYLRAAEGFWDPSARALAWNWSQQTTNPVSGLRTELVGLRAERMFGGQHWLALGIRELVALGLIFAVTCWLARRSQPALAVYAGLLFVVLASTSPYAENQRGLLVCFPAALAAGRVWCACAGRSRTLAALALLCGALLWCETLNAMLTRVFLG